MLSCFLEGHWAEPSIFYEPGGEKATFKDADYVYSFYLPTFEFGAHPHGEPGIPKRVATLKPPSHRKETEALLEAKYKLIQNRNYFLVCPTCGVWKMNKGEGCDSCAHRIYGVVY